MILRNSTMKEFIQRNENKTIVCFAGAINFQDMIKMEEEHHMEDYVKFVVDNDKRKWGQLVYTQNAEFLVYPPEELFKYEAKNLVILITAEQFPDIIAQLDAEAALNETECYIYPIMHSFEHKPMEIPAPNGKTLIPKKIHYCWFGKGDLPDISIKCMDSWKRMCPDYEIIRWDESNYDVNKNIYTREAYQFGGYAYVSDFARLDILHQEGGIYLDTDIEVVKPLDQLLNYQAYCGFLHHGARVDTGIGFGSIKQNPLLEEFMELYKYTFYLADSGINRSLNAASITRVLRTHGLKQNGAYQLIDGMACFPKEFFDPLSYVLGLNQMTEDTYSIHYGNMSWCDDGYYSLKNVRKRSKNSIASVLERIQLGEKNAWN